MATTRRCQPPAAAGAAACARTLLLAGFVDHEGAALEGVTVQGTDGVLGTVVGCHGDEAEAPRAAGLAVGDDARLGDFAVYGEHLCELGIGSAPGKVPDVNLRAHAVHLEIKYSIALRGESKNGRPPMAPAFRGSIRDAIPSAAASALMKRRVEHGTNEYREFRTRSDDERRKRGPCA